METYEWKLNECLTNRMYYTERVIETTTMGALTFTAVNQFFASKGYFAGACRARILPTFKWWALLTIPTVFVLQWPITQRERYLLLRKRRVMNKWLYSTFHLEEDENTPRHAYDIAQDAQAQEAAKAETA